MLEKEQRAAHIIRNLGVVGVSGVATAGKDTFANILADILKNDYGVTSERVALAAQLKEDLNDLVVNSFGFTAYTQTPESKTLIRPIMVAYGKAKRIQTEGTYWTEKLTQLVRDNLNDDIVPIVTDIRYDEYENDEVSWLRKFPHSTLVHVERNLKGGNVLPAANEEEARNDPKIWQAADYKLTWDTSSDENYLKGKVVEFIEWLNSRSALR